MLATLAEDLADLVARDHEVVVVHGGGPQIADLLANVGLASEFYEGLRITSPETMHYVAMALSSVNVALVCALNQAGVASVGLNGADGAMVRGQSLGLPWDRAGTVRAVSSVTIEAQWRANLLPVVSPVVLDEHAELLNCNADHVAGALSGALGAHTLVLLSDVDQLRADPEDAASALSRVSADEVRAMIASGAVRDGMRPKMNAALDALGAGAQRVLLANGRRPHALRDVVLSQIPTTEVIS